MSELKQCPFCDGFISVSTGRVPSGGWAARNKCTVCGAELTCFGETEDDAIIALLKAWNTRAERTCHYFPDSVQVAFDENDEEIETGEAYSDGCDYSCSICGFTMLGGEEGWFDETPGEYGGWNYKARFSYCPNCGAKVVEP